MTLRVPTTSTVTRRFLARPAPVALSATGAASPSPHPNSVLYQAPGFLLKGATDDEGNLKPAALMLGIKLDLEAEVHLTARVRGDITIGLY